MSRAVLAFSAVEDLAEVRSLSVVQQGFTRPGAAPLFRTPLRRGGRVCGLVLHVEGPRLLRTAAVWSADDARIIFYESSGLRFREIELSESPSLAEARVRLTRHLPSCCKRFGNRRRAGVSVTATASPSSVTCTACRDVVLRRAVPSCRRTRPW